MPLDIGVLDSVSNSNFKTLGEAVAVNSAAHQNRLNILAESSLGQILNKLNSLDPTEAASVSTVVKSELPKAIADLGAAIAGIQQMMKGAQSTPPETGKT
jgi:hypothetical protein